jgi:hypothetical protein
MMISTIRPYWCGTTQTGFGPDGEPVRLDVRCNGRGWQF